MTAEAATTTRRAHRKSRNGCGNCKKRRLKCDEKHPQCSHCNKYNVACNFSLGTPPDRQLPGTLTSCGDNRSDTAPRKRGRPRKSLSDLATKPQKQTRGTDTIQEPSSAPIDALGLPPLNVTDISILHQHTTSTYRSLGSALFWRDDVFHLGARHPFVLDLLLALAGTHKARTARSGDNERHESERYRIAAEQHFSRGLGEVIQLLPEFDAETSQPLYVAGILICFYHLARGPSLGDFLVFTQDGPAEWLTLVSGVRTILESVGSERVNSGLLASLGSEGEKEHPGGEVLFEPEGWESQLNAFGRFVDRSAFEEEKAGVYLWALESLTQCYLDAYRNGKDGTARGGQRLVLGWFYHMEDEFVAYLRSHEPIALILLSYFAVLMKVLDSCFFIDGWPEHLVVAINDLIDVGDRSWTKWSMDQLNL